MTKVPQYAAVHRVPVSEVTIKGRWGMHTSGSALGGDLSTNPIGLDIVVRLSSPASADDVRKVIATAGRACHATRALSLPVPTRIGVEMNGEVLEEPS